ncbi:MAG: glutathione S-transferase family protein [Alphaproteobacteria bacterium]|nr:glutathione S-transferase family protein [Alphaproteobacteria bacterium]
MLFRLGLIYLRTNASWAIDIASWKVEFMIKVWGRNTSVNVQKVLWALEELGQNFERVDVGGPFGGLDTPEFAKLNPNRKIPVIEDDGLVLWESGAIVRHLAETYGAGTLAPKDAKQRAIAAQWSDWCVTTLYPDVIGGCFQQLVRVTAAERDNAAVRQAAQRAGENLRGLDGTLADTPFIAGDALSFADIIVGTLMYRYMTMPIERPELPNVEAWYQRLTERPAYQTHAMLDWQKMKIPGA